MKRTITLAHDGRGDMFYDRPPGAGWGRFRCDGATHFQRLGKRPLRIPFLGCNPLLYAGAQRTSSAGDLRRRSEWPDPVGAADFDGRRAQRGVASLRESGFAKAHECTLIYARTNGSQMRLMVITAETSEVTVVQLDVPKKLQGSWLDDTKGSVHKKHYEDDSDGDGA